jgi:hypothetical protein
MFGEDIPQVDYEAELEQERQARRQAFPAFSIELLQLLLWEGPFYDQTRSRFVMKANLVHPETGKTIVLDLEDNNDCYKLADFRSGCAPYFSNYNVDIEEDGTVVLVHVFPRGLKYVK